MMRSITILILAACAAFGQIRQGPTNFTATPTVNGTPITGSGADPLDFSAKYVRDSFCGGDNALAGKDDIGVLGWRLTVNSGTAATYTYGQSTSSYPCGIRINTGTTSGDQGILYLHGTPLKITPSITPNWEVKGAFQFDATTAITAGFGLDAGTPTVAACRTTGNCIGFTYKNGDSTLNVYSCNAGTCTTYTGTVTPVANTTVTCRIWADNTGAIFASANGETAIPITSNLPNAAVAPGFYIGTSDTTAKHLLVRDFGAKLTGLVP